jgi:hypothetical protein
LHADKELVFAHSVPFKSAVIKIKEQRVNTEDGKKEHNRKNKKIPFVLVVYFVKPFYGLQGHTSVIGIREYQALKQVYCNARGLF